MININRNNFFSLSKPKNEKLIIDQVTLEIPPKPMSVKSKEDALNMVPNLDLHEAKEVRKFKFNNELFELENTEIKTLDCYVLLKNQSVGKIVKILFINQEAFIIIEQSYKVLDLKSASFQYMLLEKKETKYFCESVHSIWKKLLYINNPSMVSAFPNKVECD